MYTKHVENYITFGRSNTCNICNKNDNTLSRVAVVIIAESPDIVYLFTSSVTGSKFIKDWFNLKRIDKNIYE